MWPRRGKVWAASTRGCALAGPGPIRRRAGGSNGKPITLWSSFTAGEASPFLTAHNRLVEGAASAARALRLRKRCINAMTARGGEAVENRTCDTGDLCVSPFIDMESLNPLDFKLALLRHHEGEERGIPLVGHAWSRGPSRFESMRYAWKCSDSKAQRLCFGTTIGGPVLKFVLACSCAVVLIRSSTVSAQAGPVHIVTVQ